MAEVKEDKGPKPEEIIQQGAEARVYKISLFDRPTVVKERFRKSYRHPKLDQKIRTDRTKSEVRTLLKCRQFGIDTPVLYFVDEPSSRIYMEYVEGCTARELFTKLDLTNPEMLKKAQTIAEQIGTAVAGLHAADIVHGDLTTSNMMQRTGVEAMTVIDFGLSYRSKLVEDKAVDLYVLEKAFLSTHHDSEEVFKKVLEVYHQAHNGNSKVLQKLHHVRQRGRKRSALG